MNLVIFGNGPLPCEGQYPVTAPGGRTWQIVRTAADALTRTMPQTVTLTVVGLDNTQRTTEGPIRMTLPCREGRKLTAVYQPLSYEKFLDPESGCASCGCPLPSEISGVIGCASAQPYSTAAAFAVRRNAPLWIDVFGDPLCEIQTQAQIAESGAQESEVRQVHVWKLFLDGLLQGDRFSTLSERQRYALLGQLGCAGRLNRKTADESLVCSIPYGVFNNSPADSASAEPSRQKATCTIMWNGSFNTWMDVRTLSTGLVRALREEPRLRLMIVGGRVPGYSEKAYETFVKEIEASGLQGSVRLMDWQPYEAMTELYRSADIGISIDRPSYEAMTGSRTRIVHFLAAGVPVVTTNLTELTEELAEKGLIRTFECGKPDQLANHLLDLARNPDSLEKLAEKGQVYVRKRFNGFETGQALARWILSPHFAPDKIRGGSGQERQTNELLPRWKAIRKQLEN